MYILGINAYHGDSAACLAKDGQLIAALEEERVRRTKHWAGLPTEAVKFCLAFAGIDLEDVDYIAISRDPQAHLHKKILFAALHRPNVRSVLDRVRNTAKVRDVRSELLTALGKPLAGCRMPLYNIEHHHAHLASAFFVSPFEEATVLSVDGMGDFVSTMWGTGTKNKMEILDWVEYPHSLGFFYTALTQYLGFWKYGDEYKVMGLAAFGRPTFLKALREMVHMKKDGRFELNLDYFIHHRRGVKMSWDGGEPVIGPLFSDKLIDVLGPARQKEDSIEDRHQDIAASTQALYEEIFFDLLQAVYHQTKNDTLCFAGGTAQNSLANGKIFKNSPFRNVYIPPAGYDAGTAVGAAYHLYHQILGHARGFVMHSPFWGPEYDNEMLRAALEKHQLKFDYVDDERLVKEVAKLLADGNVVGWFQGRTEWGPRALGNRSILANPCRADMKDILNAKIKKREPFRPFAPSVLEERVADFFEESYPAPFMEKVYVIKPEKRKAIPAVTHVDGTGRLQSVSCRDNPGYWNLIKEFGAITGVPVLLNTSFNENEPIVNHPEEAIDCFLRTKMDVLVLGNYLVKRK
jgi:carbamoyltransferase